jgi:multisubunit Na+/H+ antiporter MnhC subunit
LNFTVNESFSRISYVLDYQDNITIAENTTLTDLSNGYHNVTVYAIDSAGNTGTSETIYFNVEVPEPFPTTLVATASGVSVAVVGLALLVYLKKRSKGRSP